jgi:diguanylate cyclase (GGDEF)-like protein
MEDPGGDQAGSSGHGHAVEFYETEAFPAATAADFPCDGLTRFEAPAPAGGGTLALAQPIVERVLRTIVRALGAGDSAPARSLAYVWGFGSTCLTATLLLPHPSGANQLGLVVIAVVGYLGAAAMYAYGAALPQAAMELITCLGQGLIAALTLFWGAPEAPFLWFQIWLVVHSFHFLPPVRAMAQVGFAAVLFVAVTVSMHTMFPAAASVVGVGSLVSIGLLVGAFRVHVDDLVQALATSAASDPLTGLANRRALAEAFAREQARSARDGIGTALLLLDCNRLKALNDRDGHAAGDEALGRVARAISASVRAVDTPARVGGDEFAVLLSAPDPGTAVAVGERIRRTVADTPSSDGITVSIGVVELPTKASVDLTTALAAADRAMYRSKRQRANSVSIGTLVEAPR